VAGGVVSLLVRKEFLEGTMWLIRTSVLGCLGFEPN
jgi:hypothetical protein